MALNDGGSNSQGRRVTNYQAALLDRLAGLGQEAIERGVNSVKTEPKARKAATSKPEPPPEPGGKKTDPVSLSESVRLYVLEQSGSLSEVHKATGVPKTTLGGWLKGEKDITTRVFDRICEAYGICPIRIDGKKSDHVPTMGDAKEIMESSIADLRAEMRNTVDDLKTRSQKSTETLVEMIEKMRELYEATAQKEKAGTDA